MVAGWFGENDRPVWTNDRVRALQEHVLDLAFAFATFTIVPKRSNQLGWTRHRGLQIREGHRLAARRHVFDPSSALLKRTDDAGHAVSRRAIADVRESFRDIDHIAVAQYADAIVTCQYEPHEADPPLTCA